MSRKTHVGRAKDEWNNFGLRVLDYNVDLDWGFNSAIHDQRRRSDDSPVYESHQYLSLSCVVLWPDEQSGDVFYITLSEPLKDWFWTCPVSVYG